MTYEPPINLNRPFKFVKINSEKILRTINQLNNTSATGYDNLPTSVIKYNCESLTYNIKEIINNSLMSGIVPKDLKISKIIPIHKSGNKNDPSNYRPISILPNMDKIISKLVNEQLLKYITKHNIIVKNQYGFILNSNTITALFDIVCSIQRHRDNGRLVIIIFIDIKKLLTQ